VNVSSKAVVPTSHASRYLQQLCKHWAHNFPVAFTTGTRTVTFSRNTRGADWPGDAILELQVSESGRECRLTASSEELLSALKGTVERHLDRFASREAALPSAWVDGQS
jgi:hypothetical protein